MPTLLDFEGHKMMDDEMPQLLSLLSRKNFPGNGQIENLLHGKYML
jgi:hypothetical protein